MIQNQMGQRFGGFVALILAWGSAGSMGCSSSAGGDARWDGGAGTATQIVAPGSPGSGSRAGASWGGSGADVREKKVVHEASGGSGCNGSGDASAGSGGESTEPTPDAPEFDQLKFETSGGYGPMPCSNGSERYEVTRAPGYFKYTGCDYSVNPSEPIARERALSPAEVEAVAEALSQVHPSSAQTCGADMSVITLDVTNGSSVALYADDFYSGCPWDIHAGRTFVTGLSPLGVLLREFTKEYRF